MDAMMALTVLVTLGTLAGQAVTHWVERQLSQGEARALSAWADAGETWLLQNRHRLGQAPAPVNITSAVTPPSSFTRTVTPHRLRTIVLWYRDAGAGRAHLLAVASGDTGPVPAPTPGDGITAVGTVGVEGANRHLMVRASGLAFDLRSWSAQVPGLATPGDIVALRHVWLHTAAHLYLHRTPQTDPALNRMNTDLDLGGQSLTGADTIAGRNLVTPQITGPVTIRSGITVEGAVSAEGKGSSLDAPNATIRDTLRAGTIAAGHVQTGTVNARNARVKQLLIEGGCTGCQTHSAR